MKKRPLCIRVRKGRRDVFGSVDIFLLIVFVDVLPNVLYWTLVHDPQTGLIRLEGAVWRYLDLDISHPGTRVVLADGTQLAPTDGAVPPVDQLERIGAFSIPDSFEPDLYQTILANFA